MELGKAEPVAHSGKPVSQAPHVCLTRLIISTGTILDRE